MVKISLQQSQAITKAILSFFSPAETTAGKGLNDLLSNNSFPIKSARLRAKVYALADLGLLLRSNVGRGSTYVTSPLGEWLREQL